MPKARGPHARLSERERRFVELYMGKHHGNATQAALEAGYSPSRSKKAAGVAGSELLKKPSVLHAIEARIKASPEVLDREQLQRFFSAIVDGKGHYVLLKMRDRLRAAELLGKSHKMFADVLDVNVFDHEQHLANAHALENEKPRKP